MKSQFFLVKSLFLWFSYDFSVIFLWFPIVSHRFLTFSNQFCHAVDPFLTLTPSPQGDPGTVGPLQHLPQLRKAQPGEHSKREICEIPSGNLIHSYWKYTIKIVDFEDPNPGVHTATAAWLSVCLTPYWRGLQPKCYMEHIHVQNDLTSRIRNSTCYSQIYLFKMVIFIPLW